MTQVLNFFLNFKTELLYPQEDSAYVFSVLLFGFSGDNYIV